MTSTIACLACAVAAAACGGRTSGGNPADGGATTDAPEPATTITIATGQATPDSIALTGASLVWTNLGSTSANGAVATCSTAGTCTAATPPLVAGVHGPVAIAADATNAYWNDGGSIMECALASCVPITLAVDQDNTTAIAVDATTVYWTNFGGGVMACAIGGCGQAPTAIATTSGGPQAIALDGTSVYWANTTAQTVSSCPLAGCGSAAPPTLVTGEAGLVAIAVDAANVYWIDQGTGEPNGSIRQCALPGCSAPLTLTATEAQPAAIAVADGAVYWTTFAGGTVASCAAGAAGCTPRILAANLVEPGPIALDAASVYFAEYHGTIAKVAR